MSQPETIALNAIRLLLGQRAPHCRLFRNHRGTFWAGRVLKQDGNMVVLTGAQRVAGGLAPGAADLIGWTTIEITPDMVGTKIAVFTSGEMKVGKRELEEDQEKWRDNVRKAGGFAEQIRTDSDALRLVRAT